jgi:hypothetical protein
MSILLIFLTPADRGAELSHKKTTICLSLLSSCCFAPTRQFDNQIQRKAAIMSIKFKRGRSKLTNGLVGD